MSKQKNAIIENNMRFFLGGGSENDNINKHLFLKTCKNLRIYPKTKFSVFIYKLMYKK